MKNLILYVTGGLSNRIIPMASCIEYAKITNRKMFVYWPVDCVSHLPKQKIRQPDRKYSDIVHECANRYFQFIKTVRDKGYFTIVYGPIVPDPCEVPKNNYDDKMVAAKLISEYLEEMIKNENNIAFIPMYDVLVDENNKQKREYYMDSIHLGFNSFHLTLRKIEEAIGDLNDSL